MFRLGVLGSSVLVTYEQHPVLNCADLSATLPGVGENTGFRRPLPRPAKPGRVSARGWSRLSPGPLALQVRARACAMRFPPLPTS